MRCTAFLVVCLIFAWAVLHFGFDSWTQFREKCFSEAQQAADSLPSQITEPSPAHEANRVRIRREGNGAIITDSDPDDTSPASDDGQQ